jgi:gluconokinase
MGVSGAGKTTTGRALATALAWPFHDADDFHSAANVDKMRRGAPLTDEDRAPWLHDLCVLIADIVRDDRHAVIACSALKQRYRDALVPKNAPPSAVRFVYLDVPIEELRRRLRQRQHFFGPAMLDSQLAALEEPTEALRVNGAQRVEDIVKAIRAAVDV